MTPLLLAAALTAAASAADPPTLAGVPRLGTLVEVDRHGNVRARLEADSEAAPGLVVLPRSRALIEGAAAALVLELTNASGAIAYAPRVQDAANPPRMARPAVGPGGIAPGDRTGPFHLHVPLAADGAEWTIVRLVPATDIVVVREIGGHGRSPGRLSKPRGLDPAPDGTVVVADRGNNRIQVFTHEGQLVREWGGFGSEPGRFDHPEDVAVDRASGLVFACDMNNSRVQVFTLDGGFVRALPPQGVEPLDHPGDLALAPDGTRVHVIEQGKARVTTLDAVTGARLASWGEWGEGPGQFRAPLDVEVDSTGRVYVTDGANRNVQVFAADGRHVATVSGPAAAPLRHPTAVLALGRDRLLVADFVEDRIRAFDLAGTLLGEFGRSGPDRGAMRYPADIKLVGNLLWITQTASDSITVVDLRAWPPYRDGDEEPK